MTDENDPKEHPLFGKTVYSYTRAQAIEDGVLVDVTDIAKQAGFAFPVAVSEAVWAKYCEFDERAEGQSIDGRVWDVVWMLKAKIVMSKKTDTIEYELIVAMPNAGDWDINEKRPPDGLSMETHRLVTLKAVCGPGDAAEPVITIMLPHED